MSDVRLQEILNLKKIALFSTLKWVCVGKYDNGPVSVYSALWTALLRALWECHAVLLTGGVEKLKLH